MYVTIFMNAVFEMAQFCKESVDNEISEYEIISILKTPWLYLICNYLYNIES